MKHLRDLHAMWHVVKLNIPDAPPSNIRQTSLAYSTLAGLSKPYRSDSNPIVVVTLKH